MSLPREYLEDISTQRFQENVGKQLDKKKEAIGCLGGTISSLGNNVFSITHSLGTAPSGFIILTQSVAGSIKATMVKSNGTIVNLSFDKSPGTFTVFLF